MLTTTIIDECLIEVSIAIYATISTAVVCTEIYAENTTARIALVLITFDIELVVPDALQPMSIYTTGMPNPILAEINVLSTGVDIDAILLGNLTEISSQFLSLLWSQWTNAKRRNATLNILI